MASNVRLLIVAIVCLAFCSCRSGRESNWLSCYPVKGQVLVDGTPAAGVRIMAHNVAGANQQHPEVPAAVSQGDGTFEFTTYMPGDGVPAGEYKLTADWCQMVKRRFVGPDQLNGRYSDPAKSTLPALKVAGDPIDLGKIELTTK